MVEVILLLIFLGICVVIDALESNEDELLSHDLAQPSVERLQADAERTLEELRALDYHEREES